MWLLAFTVCSVFPPFEGAAARARRGTGVGSFAAGRFQTRSKRAQLLACNAQQLAASTACIGSEIWLPFADPQKSRKIELASVSVRH